MILDWLDQQTCSSWTFASLLLCFWTWLYLGALFSAAEQLHWSIQRSNKQLGVTVDSSVALLVFCFWRIHKGNILSVALAVSVTPKIAHTIKITPKISYFPFTWRTDLLHIHAAHSGDTNKCMHTFKSIFLSFFFLFCFFIRADYIHKSGLHFSGGKKMLLSRPISWSYCVAT